jgi:hypothetical protein
MQSKIERNKRIRYLFTQLNIYIAIALSSLIKACQSIVESAEKSVERQRVNFEKWAEQTIEGKIIEIKKILESQRIALQESAKKILEESVQEVKNDIKAVTNSLAYFNKFFKTGTTTDMIKKDLFENLINKQSYVNKVAHQDFKYSIMHKEVKECAKKVITDSKDFNKTSASIIRVASYIPFIIDLLIKYNKEIIEYFKKDNLNPYQECINIQILSLLLKNNQQLEEALKEAKYQKYNTVINEIIKELRYNPSKLFVDLSSINNFIKVIFYIAHNILEISVDKNDSNDSISQNMISASVKYKIDIDDLGELIKYADKCKEIAITNKSVDAYIKEIEEVECNLFDTAVTGGYFESYFKEVDSPA